jgi:hypothetical protein
MPLLTQNSELRPHRIWNWSIPAWYATLSDGQRFITCPHAGICAKVCYARNGTYNFPNVLAAHTRNLELVLHRPGEWVQQMNNELRSRKFRPTGTPRDLPIAVSALDDTMVEWALKGGAAVRIHDSGDFFSDSYLRMWVAIAESYPDILFYAYTKEVEMFKVYSGLFPANFRYLFSTGGTQDHMIRPDIDRHADVFPNEEGLKAAGYTNQSANDLLAVLLPTTRIGIPANNIPHFNKRIAGRTFAEMTRDTLRMKEGTEK